jgi:hypothetical protein
LELFIETAWICHEMGSWNVAFSIIEALNQQENIDKIIEQKMSERNDVFLKWNAMNSLFSTKDNFARYRLFLSRRLCMVPLPTLTVPVSCK